MCRRSGAWVAGRQAKMERSGIGALIKDWRLVEFQVQQTCVLSVL